MTTGSPPSSSCHAEQRGESPPLVVSPGTAASGRARKGTPHLPFGVLEAVVPPEPRGQRSRPCRLLGGKRHPRASLPPLFPPTVWGSSALTRPPPPKQGNDSTHFQMRTPRRRPGGSGSFSGTSGPVSATICTPHPQSPSPQAAPSSEGPQGAESLFQGLSRAGHGWRTEANGPSASLWDPGVTLSRPPFTEECAEASPPVAPPYGGVLAPGVPRGGCRARTPSSPGGSGNGFGPGGTLGTPCHQPGLSSSLCPRQGHVARTPDAPATWPSCPNLLSPLSPALVHAL